MKKIRFKKRNNLHLLKQITIVLMCIVAFFTTYLLVLPAVAIDTEEADADPGIVLVEEEQEEVNI